jgi:pyrroloquinoline quinone biosynthesis protein B
LVRAGDPRLRPRTQASVAVTADGSNYLVIGASPDLRQQIIGSAALRPRAAGRDSPVVGVVLLSADIDGIAGLLVLREGHAFTVFAPPPLLDGLAANPMFGVLDPAIVRRCPVVPFRPTDCGHGLALTLLPMPGKVPLYAEDRTAVRAEPATTYAARIDAGGRSLIVAPACAQITDDVRGMLSQADAVLFDGTVFTDDEMIAEGVGSKTGSRMGHVAMAGPDGSLARLASLPGRRIFLHINNTNPVLLDGSPEQARVTEAGFEIAYDGMMVCL